MTQPGEYDTYGRLIQPDGTVIIPGSKRPDGTRRPDVRVKPNYMPPDEQVKYESRGARIARERKEAGVPGLGPAAKPEPKLSKNQKKNIRKKEQKSAGAAEAAADESVDVTAALGRVQLADDKAPDWVPGAEAESAESVEKKIKNLQKKIRQSEELEQRVARGELDPSPEQQEKLARLPTLRAQLQALTAAEAP